MWTPLGQNRECVCVYVCLCRRATNLHTLLCAVSRCMYYIALDLYECVCVCVRARVYNGMWYFR